MPDATFWVLLAQTIIQALALLGGATWFVVTQRQKQEQTQNFHVNFRAPQGVGPGEVDVEGDEE